MNGAIARIVLRYGVGLTVGMQAGEALAGDPDIVLFVAAGIGAGVEFTYRLAKKKGWSL